MERGQSFYRHFSECSRRDLEEAPRDLVIDARGDLNDVKRLEVLLMGCVEVSYGSGVQSQVQ